MQLSHLSVPPVNPKSWHLVIFPQSLFAPFPSHCSYWPPLFGSSILLLPHQPLPLLQLDVSHLHPLSHFNSPFDKLKLEQLMICPLYALRLGPSHASPVSVTLFPQNGWNLHCVRSYLQERHVAFPPLYMSLISVHAFCVVPSQSSVVGSIVPSPHIAGCTGAVHASIFIMQLSQLVDPPVKLSNHEQFSFVAIVSSHCSPLSSIAVDPPVHPGNGLFSFGVHPVVLNWHPSHVNVPLLNPKSVHDVIFPHSLL